MINELIEQIGRERLVELADDTIICKVSWDERITMARIALAVLDAKEKPAAWLVEFRENEQEYRVLTLDKPEHHYAECSTPLYATPPSASVPDISWDAAETGSEATVITHYHAPAGWKLVPVEPTEDMVIRGFESKPREGFSDPDDWGAFEAMSGCEQAAHKTRLCYAAMLAAAPAPGGDDA